MEGRGAVGMYAVCGAESGNSQISEDRSAARVYPSHGSLSRLVLSSLESFKAEDIVSMSLKGKSSIADEVIIASGVVARHVIAIADQLVRDLKRNSFHVIGMEGLPHGDWVLVDAADVIIHVFRPEVRLFYDLEAFWSSDSFGP
ncbi:MAG: ribosome silencing factor [Alphaproteobacteria bacterium]|nr:ribosome silencing factor [Alphaproteobacteria bacterium]